MPKDYDPDDDENDNNHDDVAENIPLQSLHHSRPSHDSTNSLDFDRLLSDDDDDDVSSTSSTSPGPPIDGGRGAWTFLLSSWLIESVIWGFPLAFGVFQRYYSNDPLFSASTSIPTIGTLATGISYLGMPFMNAIVLRWPGFRRTITVIGFIICVLGLLGASFATQTWQLVLMQGFMYGLGWVVCYTPMLFMLNEWFVEKRGLAYGVLFGASGVSGLVIPVGLGWLLEKFGFRTALRVYAFIIVVVGGPGLFLIRPRIASMPSPESQSVQSEGIVRRLTPFFTDRHFLLMAGAVFAQGLGYFVPNIFLPSFAESLGLSSSTSSALLALVSLSQVLGQLWQGWISDRVNIYVPLSFSALVPGIGALLLWGPAKGLAYLVPFAFIWGFFSASYSVLFTRMCTYLASQRITNDSDDEDIGMLLYGFFSFERGASNILEGPISSWLIGGEGKPIDIQRYGLGRYASVVWFTVFCMLASSSAGIGWLWRARK